ncbi:hypothetical protein WN943_018992 [Citrus x changshan-huyou]
MALCGFSLGSLVVVKEDAEEPRRMLLLRNCMSQGLVRNQPLLYASPSKDPRGKLKGLTIAWQCKKCMDQHQLNFGRRRHRLVSLCKSY